MDWVKFLLEADSELRIKWLVEVGKTVLIFVGCFTTGAWINRKMRKLGDK